MAINLIEVDLSTLKANTSQVKVLKRAFHFRAANGVPPGHFLAFALDKHPHQPVAVIYIEDGLYHVSLCIGPTYVAMGRDRSMKGAQARMQRAVTCLIIHSYQIHRGGFVQVELRDVTGEYQKRVRAALRAHGGGTCTHVLTINDSLAGMIVDQRDQGMGWISLFTDINGAAICLDMNPKFAPLRKQLLQFGHQVAEHLKNLVNYPRP